MSAGEVLFVRFQAARLQINILAISESFRRNFLELLECESN